MISSGKLMATYPKCWSGLREGEKKGLSQYIHVFVLLYMKGFALRCRSLFYLKTTAHSIFNTSKGAMTSDYTSCHLVCRLGAEICCILITRMMSLFKGFKSEDKKDD